MTTPDTHPGSFKRQVVFRLSPQEWPLLEQAARQYGSIQAALIAALQTLATTQHPTKNAQSTQARSTPASETRTATTPTSSAADEMITARQAARILGLKPDTVSSYIRSGRLSGHYNNTTGSSGWVTTRNAVNAYQQRQANN